MYLKSKTELVNLLDIVLEGLRYCFLKKEIFNYIIKDSIQAIDVVESILDDNKCKYSRSNLEKIKSLLENILEKNVYLTSEENIKKVMSLIVDIRGEIVKVNTKYKALFLPYKSSMWFSLRSIWKAAIEDPNCEPTVVLVPYYDLDINGQKIAINYELANFDKEVPIVSFTEYDIGYERPEMIFFHNPYDETNNLTRVPEAFYTNNLKKYTKCLVYSPYFTVGPYGKNHKGLQYSSKGTYIADKTILQSERAKEIFKSYNHSDESALCVGSPKVDSILEKINEPLNTPDEWQKKLKGKKVFLLNTHLFYFVNSWAYSQKNGNASNLAIDRHKEILDLFIDSDKYALIWRPHPLLKETISQRTPQLLGFIDEMEYIIRQSSNCVIDKSGNYSEAFKVADALITTYSSLINEFMVTGKPVFIFQRPPEKEDAENAPINYLTNYFYSKKESFVFSDFANMVELGKDPKKSERMQEVQKAFLNLDGSAGKKAYNEVCKIVNRI